MTELSRRQAFDTFDSEHPNVWKYFVRYAFDRISLGYQHYSARAIIHRVRWETAYGAVPGPHRYKICNNHVKFYSRKFMTLYPQHNGFFRTRTTEADFEEMLK